MGWTSTDGHRAIAGYADWALQQALVNPRLADNGKDLWVPVFVRLRLDPVTPEALRATLGQLLELQGSVLLAAQELAYLQTEVTRGFDADTVLNAVLFCRPDAFENPLWDVLDVGDPVLLTGQGLSFQEVMFEPRATDENGAPIVAVIDDGIGFLNARFRSDLCTTRLRALWVQAALQVLPNSGNTPALEVQMGRVLTRADINARLSSGKTEAAIYADLNEQLFGEAAHRSTEHHAAHGTLVLDAAAGADFAAAVPDPMAGIDLVAVQVPAAALAETSGRRLDPFVLLGFRWVINQALLAVGKDQNGGLGVPLIINLSLGSLAGPQDGTGFVESWIQYELNRFRRLSRDTPIRLVAAYGNARLSRLVARAVLDPFGVQSLDWQVQPDDATASFIEVRVPKGADVRIRLATPGGADVLGPVAWPGVGMSYSLPGPLGAVAAVYGVDEVNFQTILIAVAPTVRDDVRSLAPAGCWQLTLENMGPSPVPMSAKVQRDDTPDGFRRRGRQSWLDAADGWTWDAESADWSRPAPGSPIRRSGTGVAHAGLDDPAVYFVAAAEPGPNGLRATRYSSQGRGQGGVGGGKGPTLAALAEAGRMLPGRAGAGVVSGAMARLSGTSGAAPRVVRKLVERALTTGLVPLAQTDPRNLDELAFLLSYVGPAAVLTNPPPQLASRQGAGVLSEAS